MKDFSLTISKLTYSELIHYGDKIDNPWVQRLVGVLDNIVSQYPEVADWVEDSPDNQEDEVMRLRKEIEEYEHTVASLERDIEDELHLNALKTQQINAFQYDLNRQLSERHFLVQINDLKSQVITHSMEVISLERKLKNAEEETKTAADRAEYLDKKLQTWTAIAT